MMDDLLEAQISYEKDVCVISVVGQIDIQSMRPLREMLRSLPDEGVCYVVLDLRDVSFLDSAGMSLLFAAHKRMRERHGDCYLVTARDGIVDKSLSAIRIDQVMPHLHDLEEAMDLIEENRVSGLDGSRVAKAPIHDWTI